MTVEQTRVSEENFCYFSIKTLLWYSLESPQPGCSNVYPQLMFLESPRRGNANEYPQLMFLESPRRGDANEYPQLMFLESPRRGDANEYPQLMFLESPRRGDSNEYPQHVSMENCPKLSFNYHQIPSLSVPLNKIACSIFYVNFHQTLRRHLHILA